MKDSGQVFARARELAAPGETAVQTGPFGAQLHADAYVERGVPFILIKNIRNGLLDPAGMPSISEADAGRLSAYALRRGDVVFSRVGRVGSCFLAGSEHEGWIISGQLLRLRLSEAHVDSRFLVHWLSSNQIQSSVAGASVGTTRQSINTDILGSLPIPRMPLEEQRRIAEILDTLDEAIRKTEQIVSKLKRVKQGLLQDLLTRGVDKNGELRDPERHPAQFQDSLLGSVPKYWRVMAIEQLLERIIDYRGRTPRKTTSGVPLLTAKNVREGFLDPEPREFIAAEDYESWMTRGRPSADDVLFTTEAPLGNVAPFPNAIVALAQRVITLVPNRRELSPDFLLQLLSWRDSQRRLAQHATGSTVLGIKQSVFRKVAFRFPPLDEQEELASRIRALQTTIESEELQARKLIPLRYGLTEDLLTGRVRVTS